MAPALQYLTLFFSASVSDACQLLISLSWAIYSGVVVAMGADIENSLADVSRMGFQLPASISVLSGCSAGRSSVRPLAFFEQANGMIAAVMTNSGIMIYN